MESVEIVEVESRKHWRQFFKFPLWLYRENKFYIAPRRKSEKKLFSWKNPRYNEFILKAFLALEDKNIVGRIAVVLDKESKCAEFTRFDFIDAYEVSGALMNAVMTVAKRTGCTTVNGPVGFGEADARGILVDGFEASGMKKIFDDYKVYNYAYYPEHIEKLGFISKEDFGCVDACGCGKMWHIYTREVGS